MHQIKAVFNGNFDYIENIKVSPFSRAYTFSDSVYEVIPFYNKQSISFESHIERLQRSVDALSINLDVKKVTAEINKLLSSSSFDNGYIRTPLGGFYNHSNEPNVRRVVSDNLPKLKCGDPIDESLDAEKIPNGKASRENLYPKIEGRYMFIVSTKEIKPGEELTANYNLYTYPKTGIGLQAL